MKKRKIPIQTQAACVDTDGNFWFTSNSFNALFRMSAEDYTIEYITSFDEKYNHSDSMYTKAFYYEDKIFLIPCVSEHITIYDIAKKEAHYVFIEEKFISYNVLLLDEYNILLFPAQFQGYAWQFSMYNEKLKKLQFKLDEHVESFICTKQACLLGNGVDSGKAFFAVAGTNFYMSYDINSKQLRMIESKTKDKIINIFNSKNKTWILSDTGDLLIEIRDDTYIKMPGKSYKDILKNGTPMAYSKIVSVDDVGVIGIPVEGNDFITIENENRILAPIDWKRIRGLFEESQPYVEVHKYNNKIFFFPYQCETLLVFDCLKKEFIYRNFEISQKMMLDINCEIYTSIEHKDEQINILESKEGLSLEGLIRLVTK